MKPVSLLYLAPLLLSAASAQEPEPGAEGFLQTPSVVPSPITPDGVEPDITIREEGDQLIYEYRVNGQLYMIKIQPQIGPPYFLIDTDGDGVMDERNPDPRDIRIPQWLIFSWN